MMSSTVFTRSLPPEAVSSGLEPRRRLLERAIDRFFPEAELSVLGPACFDRRLRVHVPHESRIDVTWLGRRYRCTRDRPFTATERVLIDCIGSVLSRRADMVREDCYVAEFLRVTGHPLIGGSSQPCDQVIGETIGDLLRR